MHYVSNSINDSLPRISDTTVEFLLVKGYFYFNLAEQRFVHIESLTLNVVKVNYLPERPD